MPQEKQSNTWQNGIYHHVRTDYNVYVDSRTYKGPIKIKRFSWNPYPKVNSLLQGKHQRELSFSGHYGTCNACRKDRNSELRFEASN